MTVGFAVCGSFCTFSAVFPIMELLAKEHDIVPVFSEAAWNTDTRFGKASDHIRYVATYAGKSRSIVSHKQNRSVPKNCSMH